MLHKQSVVGCILWFGLLWFMPTSIHIVLSFSILVLVPMVFRATLASNKKYARLIAVQPYFSLFGALSLLLQPGVIAGLLSLVWLIFTIWAASKGAARALIRGGRRAEENAIDVAYIYMVGGGVWLFLSQSGINGLPFPPVIVLLTAIHFHYSSLIVPVACGLLGRYAESIYKPIKGYSFLALLIIIGPILVGIGITVGGMLDITFVVLYVLAMMWLSVESIRLMVFTRKNKVGQFFVGLAAVLSVGAMLLTVLYSSGVSTGRSFIAIDSMVQYHGYVQAFGYSLLTLVGWQLIKPAQAYSYGQFRISLLRGKAKVGEDFLNQSNILIKDQPVDGLVDDFSVFNQRDFHSENVHSSILNFYEQTNHYEMTAVTRWHGIYKPLSHLYTKVTGAIGQLHLQPWRKQPLSQQMEASIYPINETIDGRHPVKAWIRKDYATKKEIFIAFYAYYQTNEKVYMDIALPLPTSVMTGILRPQHDESDGLILTSFRKKDQLGDEGVYLTIRNWTIRLPIEEYFHVKATQNHSQLTAKHHLYFFGLRCLSIDYEISCKL